MRASAIEFRFRLSIMVVIISLGFWSPWIEAWGIGKRISLLEWLALQLSRTGLLAFNYATPAVIVVGSLMAALAVLLRVWGSAYLGPGVVNNPEMKAGAVMADGPYRHVRNPLYLGAWFMMMAMCFAMPATGALFALTLISLFLLRLIFGEEAFLTTRLGEPYLAYLRAVPRLIPQVRTNLPPAGCAPQWGKALLTELNPIGVFFTLAVLSWRYDSELMLRAILVSFGISLVVRALVPQVRQTAA
jgi:protein-S-isoprenylcysteine O-methyltransferase Ste14